MYTKITELIDRKKIVSFDIFDTLLLRNVAKPIDIFNIMESIIKTKYGIDNFAKNRIKAENEARKDAENGETNFDEIYLKLEKDIKDKKILNEIKKLELEKEEEFLVQNTFMKKIFDYCVKNNKKIFFISDMYLEKSFINNILKKCGYNNDKNNIYISCESRKNKGSSNLFKLVHDKENIKYEEWIHIGDNYNSDYTVPKKIGMEAFYYKNVNSYEDVKYKSMFESIILGIRNNFLYNGNEISYWEKFGIKYLTPIYIGFTNWIFQMTYNCDNLFFLARDGYIVEKIFKLFPRKIYTKYLYCSRNSIQLPAVLSGKKEDIIKIVLSSVRDNITLKKLFSICKLEPKKEYERIIKLYGFDSFEDKVHKAQRYDALNCVCAVFDDAKSKVLKDSEMAKKYLIQEGLNNFDRINIIDVGWGGSIQRSIQKILQKDVRGYYFGTINIGDYDFNFNSFGYMFDQDNDIFDKSRIFTQAMMYELIFSAPHGSVEKYEKKNGKIIPILKEQDKYYKNVEIFQNASLKVIREIMKYYNYYDNIDKHFCLKFYQDFLEQYNWNDLVEFSSMENDWLIGNDEKYPYVQIFNKKVVLNNYKEVEKLSRKSLWRGAFLIDGCDTEDEYKTILDKAKRKCYPEFYPSSMRKLLRKTIPLKIRKKINKRVKK